MWLSSISASVPCIPLVYEAPIHDANTVLSPYVSQNLGQRGSLATSSTGEKAQGMPDIRVSIAVCSPIVFAITVSHAAA